MDAPALEPAGGPLPSGSVDHAAGVRSGLLVVGVTLVIGVVIGLVSFVRYKHSVQTIEDLFTALVYFLEDHEGRFPATADELLKSKIVRQEADGQIRVEPRSSSRFRPQAYGQPFDLRRLDVRWGTDLSQLSFEKQAGIVRDENGHDTLLLGEVASIPGRRRFTFDLLVVHCELTGTPVRLFERGAKQTPASAALRG